jgi:Sec-independent protein translocase protein TatA
MNIGLGQLRLILVVGIVLFGNLPHVLRETMEGLRVLVREMKSRGPSTPDAYPPQDNPSKTTGDSHKPSQDTPKTMGDTPDKGDNNNPKDRDRGHGSRPT